MAVLAFALLFMLGFTLLAFSVLKWQSADISVSIVSEETNDETSGSVKISVVNTAGSKLLFYKSNNVKGKIEYYKGDEWVDFCEVEYDTSKDKTADYSDMFAQLDPGEEWTISVPEDTVSKMEAGKYRVVMTYISEKKYNDYIEESAQTDKSEAKTHKFAPDLRFEFAEYEAPEKLEDESFFEKIAERFLAFVGGEDEDESYPAQAKSEVFVKTFEFDAGTHFEASTDIAKPEITL